MYVDTHIYKYIHIYILVFNFSFFSLEAESHLV